MKGKRDGFFHNPRTKDKIKVAYDWSTCNEQIASITEAIHKKDEKMTNCEVELKRETIIAKKLQSDCEERNKEMSILRKMYLEVSPII